MENASPALGSVAAPERAAPNLLCGEAADLRNLRRWTEEDLLRGQDLLFAFENSNAITDFDTKVG